MSRSHIFTSCHRLPPANVKAISAPTISHNNRHLDQSSSNIYASTIVAFSIVNIVSADRGESGNTGVEN